MKHTKHNLDKYAADNYPRFRLLARQMLDMHTPEFDKHFAGEIATAHTDAAAALMRLALLMEPGLASAAKHPQANTR